MTTPGPDEIDVLTSETPWGNYWNFHSDDDALLNWDGDLRLWLEARQDLLRARSGGTVHAVLDRMMILELPRRHATDAVRRALEPSLPQLDTGRSLGEILGVEDRGPENTRPGSSKVTLSVWIEAPLLDYVLSRAQEARQLPAQWAGEVLTQAIRNTPLGAFCFPPEDK